MKITAKIQANWFIFCKLYKYIFLFFWTHYADEHAVHETNSTEAILEIFDFNWWWKRIFE